MRSDAFTFDKNFLANLLKSRVIINPKTNCWNWVKNHYKNGYGQLPIQQKSYSAHRVSAYVWLDFDLKSKLHVLHHCDNPSCINPEHLFIGTQSDNMKDCVAKGRHGRTSAKGSENKNALLNESDVKKIQKLLKQPNILQIQIAEAFGINYRTISNIKNGKSWKHVQKGTKKVSIKNVKIKPRPKKNMPKGSQCHNARLNESVVTELRVLRQSNPKKWTIDTLTEKFKELNISRSSIHRALTGQCWKHVQ